MVPTRGLSWPRLLLILGGAMRGAPAGPHGWDLGTCLGWLCLLPLRGSEVHPYFDGLVGLGSGLVGVGGCGFGASTRRAASCAVQEQLSS